MVCSANSSSSQVKTERGYCVYVEIIVVEKALVYIRTMVFKCGHYAIVEKSAAPSSVEI
jgi:hypothetical protein